MRHPLLSWLAGPAGYIRRLGQYNRNVRLCFTASMLSGLAQGIFTVAFNLYILSIGMDEQVLGSILSAGPFAQAVGSIPAGFMGEVFGYRTAFTVIYLTTGLTQFAQVATTYVPLIFGAAFIGGLGFAGDFVVRLPFLAANTEGEARARVFSINSMVFSLSMSLGALVGGFAPNLARLVTPDLATAYRYSLYAAGLLTLLATIPMRLMRDLPPAPPPSPIRNYLWGMDRFTFQQAVVSLFIGLSVGLTFPFFNLYFVKHIGVSREFYSIIAALGVIPMVLATAISPLIAARLGMVHAVTVLRALAPIALIITALTVNPFLATFAFWAQRALVQMSQPLSFVFAMEAADPRAKVAASAWLNVTFWLGNALAAPLTGYLLAQSNYALPFYLSAVMVLLAAWANHAFFRPLEDRLRAAPVASPLPVPEPAPVPTRRIP